MNSACPAGSCVVSRRLHARDHLRLGQGAARSRIDGLVYDNGPDGDFVQFFGAARFLDCHAHVVFIGHVAYYMPKYASSSLSLPYGASR